MKLIKSIFAVLFISLFLVSCTSDNMTDDAELYAPENQVATGDDGQADIIRDRD